MDIGILQSGASAGGMDQWQRHHVAVGVLCDCVQHHLRCEHPSVSIRMSLVYSGNSDGRGGLPRQVESSTQVVDVLFVWLICNGPCTGAFLGGLMLFLQFWPHFQIVPKPPMEFETMSGR